MTGSAATTTSPMTTGLPGANSFTENQVRSRLESDCYSNVVGLMKDKYGIWHDKATKGTVQG